MSVKSELLEFLELHKGETVSGETLGEQLGCTRAAVWKAIRLLREEGYEIEAGRNRGYRLRQGASRVSEAGIWAFLPGDRRRILVCRELASTSLEAKRLAAAGEAEPGSVVIAGRQTAGRGRRGRSFYSPEGGLYMSVILYPKADLQKGLLITTAAAAAVCRAVEECLGITLSIKWVNDLYYRGKKVCGILTEAETDFESGSIAYAVVGIGLNLRLDPASLPEELAGIAGGLTDGAGKEEEPDQNRLIASILRHLDEETRELALPPLYVERNMVPGKQILVEEGGEVRRAFAEKILPDGRLLIREENGTESRLSFGEVSVREEM